MSAGTEHKDSHEGVSSSSVSFWSFTYYMSKICASRYVSGSSMIDGSPPSRTAGAGGLSFIWTRPPVAGVSARSSSLEGASSKAAQGFDDFKHSRACAVPVMSQVSSAVPCNSAQLSAQGAASNLRMLLTRRTVTVAAIRNEFLMRNCRVKLTSGERRLALDSRRFPCL
eukprot:6652145-Pyramimonas_sp.AAC.1